MAKNKLTRRSLNALAPGKWIWDNGVGYRRAENNDGTWWIQYRTPTGRVHRKKIGRESQGYTLELAREAHSSRVGEVLRGEYKIRRPGSAPTLAGFTVGALNWEQERKDCERQIESGTEVGPFLAWSRANKRSWRDDLSRLHHLLPALGSSSLDEITVQDIERLKADLRGAGLAVATTNRCLALLKTIFSKAIEWDVVDANPVKKVKLFKENNQRTRFLSEDEMSRLLAVCEDSTNPYLATIVAVALNTGMRKMEILHLRHADLDMEHRLIRIPDSKSGEARTIPMPQAMWERFLTLPRVQGNAYVFPGHKAGHPFVYLERVWRTALKKAGIEGFRFHDLRHTAGSHLAMAGVDLTTIKEVLGHKVLTTTMRYAHVAEDHKRDALNALSGKLQSRPVPSRSPAVILTRAELYERVWSIPMTQLAREYGLSDVGLAKLCRRHRIPTPPKGYWPKRDRGEASLRRALPVLADTRLDTIKIRPPEQGRSNEAAGAVGGRPKPLKLLVSREGIEPSTRGLRVRCSTS